MSHENALYRLHIICNMEHTTYIPMLNYISLSLHSSSVSVGVQDFHVTMGSVLQWIKCAITLLIARMEVMKDHSAVSYTLLL